MDSLEQASFQTAVFLSQSFLNSPVLSGVVLQVLSGPWLLEQFEPMTVPKVIVSWEVAVAAEAEVDHTLVAQRTH